MEFVELDLAANPLHLGLSRQLVGAVGATLDLTVDLIDDLQLALDELCVSVMSHAEHSRERLQVRIEWTASDIRLEVVGRGNRIDPLANGAELTAFSQQILNALVDEHGVDERDGTNVQWLRLSIRNNTGAA